MSSKTTCKDFLPHVRGVILLLGILAGLWVTFLHPPLILAGNSGSAVNARARCAVIGDEFRESSRLTVSTVDEWDFGVSESEEAEAKKRTQECLKIATVNVPNAFLQIFVIAVATWLLMNFTRIIK